MTLFLVATPIGNLSDLSARSKELLSNAPLILAEDTRSFSRLCTVLDQRIPGQRVLSFHKFNEVQRQEEILTHLKNNDAVIISDAGTPCICDPGRELVALCHKEGVPICSVGTLCAFAAAFSCSGFEPPFHFHGFLPKKKSELDQLLTHCLTPSSDGRSLSHAFYVSPHQIAKVLDTIVKLAQEAECTNGLIHLSKEMSKIHETHLQGSICDIEWTQAINLTKGEWVLVLSPWTAGELKEQTLSGNPARMHQGQALVQKLLEQGLGLKSACKISASTFDLSSRELYALNIENNNS